MSLINCHFVVFINLEILSDSGDGHGECLPAREPLHRQAEH